MTHAPTPRSTPGLRDAGDPLDRGRSLAGRPGRAADGCWPHAMAGRPDALADLQDRMQARWPSAPPACAVRCGPGRPG